MVELYDLIANIAAQAAAVLHGLIADIVAQGATVADAVLHGLYDLDAAGASNGMDPGPLVAGGGAAGGAGVGAAKGKNYDAIYQRMKTTWWSARYRTAAGEPYFPGISPVPADRAVYETSPTGYTYPKVPGVVPPWHQGHLKHAVRDDGSIIHPPPGPDYGGYRTTAAQALAGRG